MTEAGASEARAEKESKASPERDDATKRVVLVTLLALLFRFAAAVPDLDPDLFHELALARAWLTSGHFPRDDIFAYVPTLHPTVHHEWGAGVIFYGVTQAFGPFGFLVFKYLLVAAIGYASVRAARLRGAAWPVVIVLAPAAIVMTQNAFTTIRAQLITLVMTSFLMWLLELDRRGNRLWIVPWLLAHLVWLNVHGGFVFGAMLLGAHWLEQVARGKGIQPHLVLGGIAMALLVLVNPWGLDYPRYLVRALTMKRGLIPEWNPIWESGDPLRLLVQAFALLLVLYALARKGWRGVPGILGVVASAYLGARSLRHATLFSVVWFSCVPAWITGTPLGDALVQGFARHVKAVRGTSIVIGIAVFVSILTMHPFTLRMRTIPSADPAVIEMIYPVGAVRYLAEQHFHGNALTHFNIGAYVSWTSFPNVKVSLDGRYEVAYPNDVVDDVMAFYLAKPSWRDALAKYPSDIAIVQRGRDVARHMQSDTDWKLVYRDDAQEIFARPGLALPFVDRSGQALVPPANPFDVHVVP